MKRGDRLVVVVVALAAVLSWPATLIAAAGRSDAFVVSGPGGRSSLSPRPDREVVVDGLRGPITLAVRDGAVRVISSPCPDQLCVHRGAVSGAGGAIVCAPGGVTVMVGGEDDALDAVVR